jgi:P27 family predicted phage terminase small subunit
MGNRRSGRRRVPTALKTLHGGRVRSGRAHEPTSIVGVPEMPAYLADDALALAAWQRFAARLVDMRVLTRAHGEILAVLCETWASLERFHEEAAKMGRRAVLVTEWLDAKGAIRHRIIANPLMKLWRAERQLFAQLCGEFGLTPATASKVMTQGDADATDALETLLRDAPKVLAFSTKRPRAR